jgi:hypothetical protein
LKPQGGPHADDFVQPRPRALDLRPLGARRLPLG